MYYKVVLPSERNQLNCSLLSSAPETEIGANARNDLGRPLTDLSAVFSVLQRNYPAKIRLIFVSESALPPYSIS